MYTVEIVGVLDNQIELPGLNCRCKGYKTFEEAISDIESEINEYYNRDTFKEFELKLPQQTGYGYIQNGWFKARYIFGPLVKYYIILKEITL